MSLPKQINRYLTSNAEISDLIPEPDMGFPYDELHWNAGNSLEWSGTFQIINVRLMSNDRPCVAFWWTFRHLNELLMRWRNRWQGSIARYILLYYCILGPTMITASLNDWLTGRQGWPTGLHDVCERDRTATTPRATIGKEVVARSLGQPARQQRPWHEFSSHVSILQTPFDCNNCHNIHVLFVIKKNFFWIAPAGRRWHPIFKFWILLISSLQHFFQDFSSRLEVLT